MSPSMNGQRLKKVGYIGIILGICGPLLAVLLLLELHEALPAWSYVAPLPPSPYVVVAGLSLAGIIGWVMVLMGLTMRR